jgi:hypothetical protein
MLAWYVAECLVTWVLSDLGMRDHTLAAMFDVV